jgi:hypothetical protein
VRRDNGPPTVECGRVRPRYPYRPLLRGRGPGGHLRCRRPGGGRRVYPPIFSSGLLAEEGWLPEEYQVPAPESGMGGGIGQWLLFLSAATSTGCISPAWSAAALATAGVAYPQSSEPACSWYVVTGPEPDLRRRTMGARGPESPCPSPLSSDPGSGSRTGGRRGPGTSQPRSGRGSPGSPA